MRFQYVMFIYGVGMFCGTLLGIVLSGIFRSKPTQQVIQTTNSNDQQDVEHGVFVK